MSPRRPPARVAQVHELFPVLTDRLHDPAANLSGGQQQMLALGMALVSRPRLLVIDELSLGLAPLVVEQLLEVVRAIRDQGTTIIVVEQSVNVALTIADRAYFMEKGEVRYSGPTADLLDRPDLVRSVYLASAGRDLGDGNGHRPPQPPLARRPPPSPSRWPSPPSRSWPTRGPPRTDPPPRPGRRSRSASSPCSSVASRPSTT